VIVPFLEPVPVMEDVADSAETPVISVVVPLRDERENLDALYQRLHATLEELDLAYEVLFVDDGSRDGTAERIAAIQRCDAHLKLLRLSRSFGHQAAVSAGLDHALGQAVVVMDGDLQDPPELIPEFVRLWREGGEVVYAVRRRRKEGPLKRLGYSTFYRLLRVLSDLDIPLDSGDFCLLDRAVVSAIKQLPERLRFVRGLRAFVGFRQVGLPYDRDPRQAGRSKYPFHALMKLAVDGLVSFSSYPLRLVTYLGIASAAGAALLMVWVFLDAFRNQTAPRGWASTIVVVLFMGSIQLISLGIIGEYIRLIFLESKGRPTYIVREFRENRRRRRAERRPMGIKRPRSSTWRVDS
jgi:dolichol-phosphate mannosyltransferase